MGSEFFKLPSHGGAGAKEVWEQSSARMQKKDHLPPVLKNLLSGGIGSSDVLSLQNRQIGLTKEDKRIINAMKGALNLPGSG